MLGDFVRVTLGIKIGMRSATVPLLAVVLLLWTGAVASADDTTPLPVVPVQIGAHADYTRIVFDFPKLLAYHVTAAENDIKIVFDTKARAVIGTTKSPLIKKIAATPENDGTLKVDISLAAGSTFKHYRLHRKIVVDVLASSTAPKVSPAPPEKPIAESKEKKEATPAPAKPTVAAVAPTPLPTPATPTVPVAAAPVAAAPVAIAPVVTPQAPVKEVPHDITPALSEPSDMAAARLPEQTASAPPTWNLSVTKPETPSAPDIKPPLLPAARQTSGDEGTATITLSSLSPLRLAVFERLGALWIIEDSVTSTTSLPMITGPMAAFIQPPKILKFEKGIAYRYTFPKKFYPRVTKRSLSWDIALLAEPLPAPETSPDSGIKAQFDPVSGKASLMVPLKGAGEPIAFEDPEIGDTLYVVPTNFPQQSVRETRHLTELEIMPALTGVVIRPLKDGIAVHHIIPKRVVQKIDPMQTHDITGKVIAPQKDANVQQPDDLISITSPNGLSVTAAGRGISALVGTADEVSDNENTRLFDFPNWRRGGLKNFQENKQDIQDRIAATDAPEERAGLLMKLATLYFSNNFGQETLGILDLVLKENPEIDKNPNFIALRGAANAMSGHYKDALQDLSFPAIQQHPEVALWIGFAAAATEQWHMADRSFPKSNRLLLQYPDNIAIPFTVYMAESALRLGHTDIAEQLLASLDKSPEALEAQYHAAINYLKGEAFSQKGDQEQAATLWQSVADGLDRLYHTKATLSLTRLLLQQKKITLKDAIDRIDSLRFAWRGDGLEVEVLHTLGALKVQDNQILSGLEDMKQAADLADSILDDSAPIRDDMKHIFSDLFLADSTGTVKPLEVVSVYDEFSSLMPPAPPESGIAALNLADNLIRMDLLGRAAAVIEEQLRNGLPEEKVTALGTKLAAVYLLDSRPSQALAALKETERTGMTNKSREERTLLRARAQSQMNQTADAISTLSTLNSRNAQRLKADVLWRAGKWGEAAAVIEVLLPDPAKAISDEDAAFVVNAAVAWKLAGNLDKLKGIKSKYAAAMSAKKLAATFGVVTRDGGSSALADRDSLLKIAGEVDMFRGFLDNYKAGASPGS